MKYTKEQLDIMSQAEFDKNGICTNIEWSTRTHNSWDICYSPSWAWEQFNYRIKFTSQYVPYTNNDLIVGKIVIRNDQASKAFIVLQGNTGVHIGCSSLLISYQELLDNYQLVNKQGKPYKPAGKLITQ